MGALHTGIELQDNFTNVIMGVINSVNLAVSAMEDMSYAMNTGVDTASLEGARDQINQATIAANELSRAFQRMVEPPAVETVVKPIVWQSDDTVPISSLGMERFEQEVQKINQMLGRLNATQLQVEQTAQNMDILPAAAVQDIAGLGTRIQKIQQAIQKIESNHIDIGTDVANAELEQMREQLNRAVQEQNNLNRALENLDVSEANAAYMRLSRTIGNTERYICNNAESQEDFNESIMRGTYQADNLFDNIKRGVAAYVSLQSFKGIFNASDGLTQTTTRLNLMNDGAQTTENLLHDIYMAAEDARGSFTGMADIAARFGNNAKDAFGSTEEVVAFTNLIQKQMSIAGASTEESSSAILQLSQALGSGVLRGDELNSIFEHAPNLIQNIADYLDVPIGKIREMASDGEISADTVRNAIFAATDEINAKFDSMPTTWGKAWESMGNDAVMAFQPVLEEINAIPNSESFQIFADNVQNTMENLADVTLNVLNLLEEGGAFVADNWGVIAPIIATVAGAMGIHKTAVTAYNAVQSVKNTLDAISIAHAELQAGKTLAAAAATTTATGAQVGLNAAMLACPVTWIIGGILLLVGALYIAVGVINKVQNKSISATGLICGGINVANKAIEDAVQSCWNFSMGVWNVFGAVADNTATLFRNTGLNILIFFDDIAIGIINMFIAIGEAIDKLPFIECDTDGLKSAASAWAATQANLYAEKGEYTSIEDAYNRGANIFETFEQGWVKQAFDEGYNQGTAIEDMFKSFFDDERSLREKEYDYRADEMVDNTSALKDIGDDTSKISEQLEITAEDLKYLRDMAEQEVVNRYTTASITVNQTNHNTVNNDMDLDGITEHLRSTMEEQMLAAAEGVH